jgi:hypothetical protein
MANTTQATPADVDALLAGSAHPQDGRALCDLMAELSGEPPVMWGPTMVGFGRYRYKYDSGREGEAFRVGFSPRKAELVLYVLTGEPEQAAKLAGLGKHRTGKSCLYVKRLAGVDMPVLRAVIADTIAHMDARYPRE